MRTILMLALTAALVSAAPALAQEPPAGFDARWSPYVGCWTIVQSQRGLPSAPVAPGTQVCVQPSGRFGVTVTTTVDGKNVLEQVIIADGSAQPLSQADCRGTQTSNWSRDGERLFTRVELECAARPKRTVSGITLLTDGYWVDAQATVVDGYSDVRVRRYRRADGGYTGGTAVTSAPLTIEDVIEASANVQSPALEAALDEVGGRVALNSRVLRQLADNGVSPNVIDLMVAQAYPDKFQVERYIYPPAPVSTTTSSVSGGGGYLGSTIYAPMYDPFFNSYYYYSPFAYPYYWGPSFSYRYGYGYGYGYPYYPSYYNYYGYPGSIYLGPSYPGGGGGGSVLPGSPDSPGGSGVVVNGRGYTRVRPAGSTEGGGSATPSSRTTGSGSGVRGVGSSSGDSSSSSGPSSSGSSSGGSSGGSIGGGGRTAQPR